VEFRHIVRVAATELKGDTPVQLALTRIKGVGPTFASATVKALGLDPKKKIGEFSDKELKELEEFLKNPKGLPTWLLNRRRDPFTGKDMHLVSSDLTIQLKQDLDYMKKIKSYRGMRHAFGLKVRGQRTKSTGRKGRTIGVQRKKSGQQKKKEGGK